MDNNETPDVQNHSFPEARGYQQEMLAESLQKNIVVALDTGSGKTLIAILRIKHFLEVGSKKVAWFIAPTVVLCEQQRDVISSALPVPVGFISGACEPNQWKDPALWRRVLDEHRVVVSTPQVLLDALRHGYIHMGSEIGIIIFDEAHHVADKHPYNRIMVEFYFSLPERPPGGDNTMEEEMRPMVLGLTASPSFGGDVAKAFNAIEKNLDGLIRAPVLYREELSEFVHRPIFNHLLYDKPPYEYGGDLPSSNYMSLRQVKDAMDIKEDPYIHHLQRQLGNLPRGEEWTRVDQKLSKTIQKQDSYTHRGIRDFERAAEEICIDLGPWAADWYVHTVVERAKASASPLKDFIPNWQHREKEYLTGTLSKIITKPVSYDPADIVAGTSSKVQALVHCLLAEKAEMEALSEEYSCLIFVTRRDSVVVLGEVLTHHPVTAELFRTGCLVGSSDSMYRRAFLDITRELVRQKQSDILQDFRIGEKNVIVSTAVAEEGIDIQACGTVVRWDPPQNMVSWAQSRGRARRRRSSFVLMFQRGGFQETTVQKWEALEREMTRLYYAERQVQDMLVDEQPLSDDAGPMFRVESTGALLTLQSAIEHLEHFCAVMPNGNHAPIYEIDPPDLPEGWHSLDPAHQAIPDYQGPFGAKVTLPKLLKHELRVVAVDRTFASKQSARAHVAFKAYLQLYEHKLLNDNLLPLTSMLEPDGGKEVEKLLEEVEKRDGMANVSLQMDPWVLLDDLPASAWHCTELIIGTLPVLRMFTQVNPLACPDNNSFVLYPGEGPPVQVNLRQGTDVGQNDTILEKAREYTRRLFWALHGTRMTWEKQDFSYLFLPVIDDDHSTWDARRMWWNDILMQKLGHIPPEKSLHADADLFGKQFSWPDDPVLAFETSRPGKLYRFKRWRNERLTSEEETAVFERMRGRADVSTSYPIIEVEESPRRLNLLLPPKKVDDPPFKMRLDFIPEHSKLILASPVDVQYALLLPSILRYLTMFMTLQSLRTNVLAGTAMEKIPSPLLMTAITAPSAQEQSNYQRLETLGDTALKYIVSHQLLAEHPLWHEGYLSRRKDHMVSNAQLAKQAVNKKLYRWIIRDVFSPKKWKPRYLEGNLVPVPSPKPVEEGKDKPGKKKQALSTKVIADVVESLLGAAYLTGGIDLVVDCASLFGLGLASWKHIPIRVNEMLSVVEPLDDPPAQLIDVELILGYEFTRKALLVEALTHCTHQSSMRTLSYERMEFLGDAVLDMIVTEYLYNAPGKEYSPGYMHLRKSAVVNAHFLGYVCLRASRYSESTMPVANERREISYEHTTRRVHLGQCLLHSSPRVLDDQLVSYARYERSQGFIEKALAEDSAFPWAGLTRVQATKFFSDMVESLIGAIYLDSGGNLDVVKGVLRTLGILQVLERIVADDMDVQHPVSRLGIWAAKNSKKVEYAYKKGKNTVSCTVLVDGEVQVEVTKRSHGKISEKEARFTAAERAVKVLEVETMEELLQAMLYSAEEDDAEEGDE